MLARDWYYNERRRIGLDSAVAAIYDHRDDRDLRARGDRRSENWVVLQVVGPSIGISRIVRRHAVLVEVDP